MSAPVMPAASLCKTFGKLSDFAFLVCWLACLPTELILHRRVGKRYQNTVFFVLSQLVLVLVVAMFLPSLPLGGSVEAIQARAQAVQQQLAGTFLPFNILSWTAIIAFLLHWWCNRRRFGTPEQIHSFDVGIPWLIYPPALLWRLFVGRSNARAEDGGGAVGGAPGGAIGSVETLAYPATGFLRNARRFVRHHFARLNNDACPYGPLTWLTLAVIEPAILIGTGLAVAALSSHYSGFGVYLAFVGFALFIKGRIYQAQWREWVYDQNDQRIEMEAKRNWFQGKPATELSDAFTMPVSRAVIPPQRPGGFSEPKIVGAGVDPRKVFEV